MKPRFIPSSDNELAEKHLWHFTAVRDLIILITAAVLLLLLYSLRGIFLPLFIALVLAYLVNPPVTRAESEWRWPRPLTASLILLTTSVFIFGFLLWLGPILTGQVTDLTRKLPVYLRTLSAHYDMELGDFIQRLEAAVQEFQSNPRQMLGQIFQTTGLAIGVLTSVFSTALYVVISLVLVALTPAMVPVRASRTSFAAPEPISPAAFNAPLAAADAASVASRLNSLAPAIAPSTAPLAALAKSPPTSKVCLITLPAVAPMVSKACDPVS